MHEHYEKNGYTIISKNPTRDINAKGHKGIDGVYYKKDGHQPFIIGEAKYGSGSLSTLADGVTQQMSTEWVLSRLDSCLNESDAQLIRALIQSKSDLVGFRIVNVKKSGEVIIKNLGDLL